MTLADFTCAELCTPALRAGELESVLFELSEALHDKLLLPSPLACFNAALNQCYPGEGDILGRIAHRWARLPAVKAAVFAAGRIDALAWQPGASPVNLVLLVAAPHVPSPRDLDLLAGIQRLAVDANTLDALLSARSARAMHELFARVPATAPAFPHSDSAQQPQFAASNARGVTSRPATAGSGREAHRHRE